MPRCVVWAIGLECGAMMSDAIAMTGERKISELPVVDAEQTPAGLIDIADVVGMLPRETLSQFAHASQRSSSAVPPSHRSLVIHEPDDLSAT